MKKVLLTAMTLVSIATSSVFGYYGGNGDWIDFLTDGNQFRARTRQMGVVLGNGTIKGVFGFRDESETALGQIFNSDLVIPNTENGKPEHFLNFTPTVSAGIGYTTEAFGIGIGYNYRYQHSTLKEIELKSGLGLSIHSPVLAMNFLGNNLRIVVPMQIAVHNGDVANVSDKEKYMGISLDPQIRYYTGMSAFSEVRLTVKYGMNQYTGQDGKSASISSLGFDFRAYFGAQVGDVGLKPFLKVTYDTALDKNSEFASSSITAGSGLQPTKSDVDNFDSNPWTLSVLPTLGLSANSDIVNLYVEAGLGYTATGTGKKDVDTGAAENTGIRHSLAWKSYGEISIRPVQDLEWYFEAEIASPNAQSAGDKIKFNSATGITWYLPSFQN